MDRDYLQRVELRRELLAKYDDTVHGCLPEGRDAVRELYTLLLGDLLPARFPAMFKTSASRTSLTNVATGKVFPTSPSADGAAMLRVMGETVEEDMFLLEKTPDGHRCVAFICCFPSGFDPSAKLGKLLKEIHAPVPSYEKIGPSMERFFAKLEAGNAVKRMNVSSPPLFLVNFSRWVLSTSQADHEKSTKDAKQSSGQSKRILLYSIARSSTIMVS